MRGDETSRNLVAAISYFMGPFTGIVVLLTEKENKFIRFHAWQSILVFLALFIINVIIAMLPLGIIAYPINGIITLAVLFVWITSMVKAYRGEIFKWFVVGNIAEKRV